MTLLTVSEACRLIGGEDHPINPATLWRWVKAGRISPPIRRGAKIVRFDKSKLAHELGIDDA